MAKTQVSTLELTCNTKRVKQELKEYERLAQETMQKLAILTDSINAKRSKGLEITKEEIARQKQLQNDIKLYTSAQQKGIDDMQRAAEVMKNLANASIKDVNKAIRDFTKEMNSVRDPKGIRVLQGQIDKLKAALTDKKGLTMSVREAKQQIADLANVRTDKLQQGLAALRHEWEALSETDRTSRAGKILQGNIRQYEAQLAVNQVGAVSTKAVSGLSTEALQAERSALNTALGAVSQSPTFAKYEAEYKARLEEVNKVLKERADLQAKADKAARDAAAFQEKHNQAYDAFGKILRGQKVSLKELTDAYAQLEVELKQTKGANLSPIDQGAVDGLEKIMTRIKTEIQNITGMDLSKVFSDIDSQSLEQLEAALKQVKENAANIKIGDDKAIQQAAEQMDILEKKIAETKARLSEHVQLAQQGMEANRTLANLETASYEDLEKTLKFLQDRQSKLQGTETKRLAQNIANQDKVKKKMQERKQLLLSEEEIQRRVGNAGKYSINELQQAYDQLERKLRETHTEEKEAIKETRKQMKTLKKEINEAKGEVTGLEKIWRTAVRNIATYVGVFAGFNYVKGKIMEIVRGNVQLSDSMAQVQKVTGLTKKEVDSLNESFGRLDTRTTLTQLNDLAYSAGKMGLGQYGLEGIRQFVESANQLQVALGDDLGASVEESITPLAKLAENLGLLKSMGVEQSMLAIGSSINELSQTTTAAGRNIVDFARRIQPSAQMIGLTTDEILALGSASDSFGVASEISATAFTKFLAAYRTNTAEIERILGITRGTLDEFFDQGRTMEGLLTIFQRMHEIGDLRYLEEAFKALGSEGSRMFTTFGAFAKNIDMFKEHLTTSTVAFNEATSVTREYNLVQDTAAGIIERANNIWEKAFVNPEGVDTVKELAIAWKELTEDLTGSESWMWGARQSLQAIATLMGTIVKLAPILIRALMFYGIAESIRRIYIQMTLLNTSMAVATTTAGKLSAVLKSNVWTLAGAAIIFATTALIDMAAASKKAEKELDAVADAEKKATDESVKERAELKKLYDATKDTTKSIDERKEALRKMVGDEKYKQYKSDLSDEQVLAREAAKAYGELTNEIIKSAKARAYQQKITELTEKNIALEDANEEANTYLKDNKGKYEAGKKEYKDQQTYVGRVTGGATAGFPESVIAQRGAAAMQPAIIGEYEQKQQDVINNQESIKKNDADILKLEQKIKALNVTDEAGSGGGGGGGGGNGSGGNGSGSGSTKELNAEYSAEQAKAKGLIDNIKNYYQRQMNAVRELANETDMSEGDMQVRIDRLTEHMNNALANARKAIGGEKNEWEKFKADMRQDMYEQTDAEGYNFSENLLDSIMDNQLEELRSMILALSEKLNKQGNVLLDQILRKATENEGKNISLAEQQRRKLEKEMLEKNYTGKVDRDTINTLESFDIGGLTAKQDEQLLDWSRKGGVKSTKAFVQQRLDMWQKALAASRQNFIALLDADVSSKDGQDRVMRMLFGDNYQEALQGSALEGILNMSAEKWQVFYQKLIYYNDMWTDAQKKGYEEQKKLLDYRFENRADVIGINNQITAANDTAKVDEFTGANKGTNFSRLAGFTATPMEEDSELRVYDLKLEKARLYYEEMQRLRDQDKASEEMLLDAKQQMTDAENAMAQAVLDRINENIQKLEQWTAPIEQFGSDVGAALGKTLAEGESFSEGMRNALKSLVQSWGESTIQIVKNLMMQQLRQKLVGKTMVKQEKQTQGQMTDETEEGGKARLDATNIVETGMANVVQTAGQQILQTKQAQDAGEMQAEGTKATGTVMAGIAEGAAKIIGTLGPWGAPLIAVITALLMGLLAAALGALGKGGSSDTAAGANTKVKLKSGMLTYDSGNLGVLAGRRKLYDDGTTQVYDRDRGQKPFVGQDGRVYMATEQPTLPEGVSIVRQPIATTVNGQQALVAEKGPEIVIGRKTTKRIMMNEPRLLASLMQIERGNRLGRRLYDEGNLGDVQSVAVPQQQAGQQERDERINDALAANAAALEQNAAAMAAFAQIMTTIQSQGIPAKLNRFGKDSLDEGMREVSSFRKRYPG